MAPEHRGARGWQSTRPEGQAGWSGRTCKVMLRSSDFILQTMTRLVKILELKDDLLGWGRRNGGCLGERSTRQGPKEEADTSI